MPTLDELKTGVFDYTVHRLGAGVVDVELCQDQLETAYQQALGVYKQRSQNATEESYAWVELQENINEYTLPDEITHVRQIFRRTMGSVGGAFSTSFDPFSSATLNVYLLNFTYSGGLSTYEMYSGYVEQAMRMFGGYMNYTFNNVTKKLTLIRDPKGDGEVILLWTYNHRPEAELLTDHMTSQWIKDYTLAVCKYMLGEARSKFATIAGPQGGSTLNGDNLKAEAQGEMEKLENEVAMNMAGGNGYGFVIG